MKYRLLTVFLLSLLLVSCGKKSHEKRIKEGTLRICFAKEPPTFDPRKGGDVTSSTLQFMMLEGLTRMTEQSTTEPALASSIEISDDLMTYTFYMRDDIHWSDGSPITSKDVERSWKAMLTPGFPAPSGNLLYPVKNAERAKRGEIAIDEVGIESVNDKTLLVKLEHPCSYFLELTSFCALFPAPKSHAISSGPFMLKKWKKGRSITLVKNPKYWDEKHVKLKSIHIDFIDDDMTALQLFEKGQLDILGSPFSEIPLDAVENLLATGQIEKKPIAATMMFTFNTRQFPFNNMHMRKAVAFAINREELVNNVTCLGEEVATGAIPPILKGHARHTFFRDGDVDRAREHLEIAMEEMGITLKDLQNFPLVFSNTRKNQKIAQAIQDQLLQNLGILIQLEGLDFAIYLNKIRSRDFVMGQTGWVAQYNDPMNILARFVEKTSPLNETGWEHPEYKSLLKQSIQATDMSQRGEYLQKAEMLFVSEMPLTGLFHWNQAYMRQPYVRNMYISPIGSFHLGKVFLEERDTSPVKVVASSTDMHVR